MFPSTSGPVYNIPPPGFIARNYDQRPREQFSLEARQLLFSYAKDGARGSRVLCAPPKGHMNAPGACAPQHVSASKAQIPSDTDRYYE
jgi:hypothetical protein